MNTEDLYWFTFILVTIVGYFTFKLLTRYRHLFSLRGVAYEKPHFIYGNLNDVLSGKQSTLELVQEFYIKFKDERLFGFYNYLSPVFYIRDPRLVRKLWVQEFKHFANHEYFLDENKDAILGNQLHLLKDDKWKQMRQMLNPIFTEKNVALITSLVRTNSLDLVDYFKASVDQELEFKGSFQKHVFNVIASCAFGLELNTFKDESDPFCHIGSSLVSGNNPVQTLKTMMFYLFPSIMTKMKVQLMESSHAKYFLRIIRSVLTEQKRSNLSRPDMIQFLKKVNNGELPLDSEDEDYLQMRDFSKRKWSDVELIAQCVTFFGTGFETMVNLLSFASYELAANPDVQQRLLLEIQNNLSENPLTYETVNRMTYLDMVISETLRKWPASPSCDRQCTKDFQLSENGFRVQFRKGDSVWVSLWAMHRDEHFFPEPERFDPERFGEANRDRIRNSGYMPFGLGQRNCIGKHFALLVAKVTLVDVIRNFELRLGSKIIHPLRLAKGSVSLEPEGGFWIQIVPR
ncbi:probable cytochrome P450 9f2 [Wyeomyia smithii]|uniref:probable cytochrome P450 9f2 n=1 Tax=Wyeomyia smithii TaxID=174621 RepID=UPI002467E037|nr:probable cytochrome P450 9f2 [Wyeomyia smithii]